MADPTCAGCSQSIDVSETHVAIVRHREKHTVPGVVVVQEARTVELRHDHDDCARQPGLVVDGDMLRDAITEAAPREWTDAAARELAGRALDGAVRAGLTVLHGPNHRPREVAADPAAAPTEPVADASCDIGEFGDCICQQVAPTDVQGFTVAAEWSVADQRAAEMLAEALMLLGAETAGTTPAGPAAPADDTAADVRPVGSESHRTTPAGDTADPDELESLRGERDYLAGCLRASSANEAKYIGDSVTLAQLLTRLREIAEGWRTGSTVLGRDRKIRTSCAESLESLINQVVPDGAGGSSPASTDGGA